jgi:hypothetical protein
LHQSLMGLIVAGNYTVTRPALEGIAPVLGCSSLVAVVVYLCSLAVAVLPGCLSEPGGKSKWQYSSHAVGR